MQGKLFASGYLNATASTSAKEILHIVSGASAITQIHDIIVTNRTTVSQMHTYSIAFAGTTGVVGTTAAMVCLAGATASLPADTVYGVAGSTSATGLSVIWRESVNTLNGLHYIPTPEMRPVLRPSQRLVVRREAAADDYAMDVNITWEEIG